MATSRPGDATARRGGRDMVCIGASAGGVEILMEIAERLPADYPGSLFVVVHMPPDNPSVLARVLDRKSALRVEQPIDGQRIERGHIYVAPPDHHLLVKRGYVRVTRGPKENGFRPAVDPLFRTAALAYGPRAVGVILSGNLDDGTVGLAAIKQRGGIAIAQDPSEALYSGMPRSAQERVSLDHVASAREIPELLSRLAHELVDAHGAHDMTDDDDQIEIEADVAELDPELVSQTLPPGTPSGYGCPDCGGALYTLSNGELIHFRCRVGHAWSPDALLDRQGQTLDDALWTALRALEENVALSVTLAKRMRGRGNDTGARRFEQQARTAMQNAETIRAVLSHDRGTVSREHRPAVLAADASPRGNGPEPEP
jgi:two-component system chemotaxis response regulator CheB